MKYVSVPVVAYRNAKGSGRVTVVLLDGAGQVVALALGLDHADDVPVDVQDVVRAACREGELADRHALPRLRVDLVAVLYDPAGRVQHPVDGVAGLHLVERGRPLRTVDDRLAALGVHLPGLLTGCLVLRLLSGAQLIDLRGQLLDAGQQLGLVRVGAGDEVLGLGPCLALGFESVAGLGEPGPGLGEGSTVAVEGLPQLGA